MKRVMILFILLSVLVPEAMASKNAGSVGLGRGITIPSPNINPCPGSAFIMHYDGTAENGYAWQYGGVVPPEWGAFAECFEGQGSGVVCGIELHLTGIGYPCTGLTAYVWADNGGMPGYVVGQSSVNPCPVANWPSVSIVDIPVLVPVPEKFWVGYWANFANQSASYFIAADLDGLGPEGDACGCPFTNIAPGIGYPTGWQSVNVVQSWGPGPTKSLGIGAWYRGTAVPCNRFFCPENVVANGDFTEGIVYGSMPDGKVDDWSLLTGTPQVMPDSCDHSPGAIWMWGNQGVGESIQQHLPDPGFVAGKTYRVTVCYRFCQMSPERPNYVRFRLAVSPTAPSAYPPLGGYQLIGITPNRDSNEWQTYTFPDWYCGNPEHWIMVNPENDEHANDGSKVSSGRIDNICIEEVSCPVVANYDFTKGIVYGSMPDGKVDHWSLLTGTPQVMPDSCTTAGSIWMWGNQVVGESIQQELPGAGLVQGKTYRTTICYRFCQMSPERPNYVRFRLAVSPTPPSPSVYPPLGGYQLIGITPNISVNAWSYYTFPDWQAPMNAFWLMVNPENDEHLNDGSKVSSGRIDNICIEEVSQPTGVPVGAPFELTPAIQNRPNPFTASTTIHFDLAGKNRVSLRVYDASGRLMRELLNGSLMEAGSHELVWDGRNDAGSSVERGVYFYQLDVGGVRQARRMILAR